MSDPIPEQAYNLSINWYARRTDESRFVAGASGALAVFVWQINPGNCWINYSLLLAAIALLFAAISYLIRWEQENNARDIHIRVISKMGENEASKSLKWINKIEPLGIWLGRMAPVSLAASVLVLAIERMPFLERCLA